MNRAEKRIAENPAMGNRLDQAKAEPFTPEEMVKSNLRVVLDGEWKKKSKNVERDIESTVSDMAMEGFVCTEEDKEAMRRLAYGQSTIEEELNLILRKHQLI